MNSLAYEHFLGRILFCIAESNRVPDDRANGLIQYCSDQEEFFVYSECVNVYILIQAKIPLLYYHIVQKTNRMESENSNSGIA